MIKVTLEFPSVEAAIATLGKIMVGASVKSVAQTHEAKTAEPPAPAAPTSRKPRADAGKKRGPHQTAAAGTAPVEGDKPQPPGVTPAPVAAPETAAPASEANAPSATVQTQAPAAAAPSEADAQAALEKVFAGKGLQAAQATLASFGVTRLRDIKPEDRAAFIAAAEKAAA